MRLQAPSNLKNWLAGSGGILGLGIQILIVWGAYKPPILLAHPIRYLLAYSMYLSKKSFSLSNLNL